MCEERNIVMIGMPGVGKSTVGVLLAKATSRPFIDTDVQLQAEEGKRLQEILDAAGTSEFRRIEEQYVLSLDCRGHVIATGGSVVYSIPAMDHLKSSGVVLHLDLPLVLIERRLTNLDSRGVVMERNQTLGDLFDERLPLYERWADVTVDCQGLTHEQVVDTILDALAGWTCVS